ncbi:sensor histidine kinase [Daejeonella lutea]|nr:HAMP domain-containing sensor histidine kinase [Daejeonella lutea]
MKLFTQYNRVLLLIGFFGLLVIGSLFYQTLSYYLNKQIDNYLLEELLEVQDYDHKMNIHPAPILFKDLVIEYRKVEKFRNIKIFADTVFFNPKKQITESARYLKTGVKLQDGPYNVTIITSKVESQNQVMTILLVIIIPVLVLLLILLVINRLLMRRLWDPFRQLLENIKSFNLNKERPYETISTPILEFQELNNAILDISLKVRSDFQEIKLFTENASHEMMTPLAVINAKLDTLLQSNTLGKEESDTLIDLYRATSRLTKLNQSLLLLVKIDNDLMGEKETVDLMELIEDSIVYFRELIQERDLTVFKNFQAVSVFGSRQLLEIMVNNLFSNAIRHNYEGGSISIILSHEALIFRNTSNQPELDESVFDRFSKGRDSEGTGLGLSILRQISSKHGMRLTYEFKRGDHCFIVTFKPEVSPGSLK